MVGRGVGSGPPRRHQRTLLVPLLFPAPPPPLEGWDLTHSALFGGTGVGVRKGRR